MERSRSPPSSSGSRDPGRFSCALSSPWNWFRATISALLRAWTTTLPSPSLSLYKQWYLSGCLGSRFTAACELDLPVWLPYERINESSRKRRRRELFFKPKGSSSTLSITSTLWSPFLLSQFPPSSNKWLHSSPVRKKQGRHRCVQCQQLQ